MKRLVTWLTVSTAVLTSWGLAIAPAAHSETIQAPLAAPVTVTGNSGGTQSSNCGFIGNAARLTINVSQTTPIRFKLQGQGQPTLWITGPVNRCVMADNLSGGNIEIPGLWQPGTYSVFVGDLSQGSFPYTLSVSQD